MTNPLHLPARRANRALASPRARRLMREFKIAPATIKGTGPRGRIVARDVTQAAGMQTAPAAGGLSPMRRAIAQKTAASFSTVPHFYLRVEADIAELLRFKEQSAPAILAQAGVKPTLTDFLLRAMARAAAEFPFANSVWQHDTIVQLPGVDLGLVVGLKDGLLVPVVRNVDRLTLAELARTRAALVTAARTGRLPAADTQGGAMSLSNLGDCPVDDFAAVIAPGQSSMLAVGRAAPRPRVVGDQLVVRTTLRLCLAADHRVMDGAPAAHILGRIVDLLEHPG